MKKIRFNYKSKGFIASVVLILLIGGGVFAYAQNHNENKSDKPKPVGTTAGGAQYDIKPATNQEKEAAEKHKDDLTKPPAQNTTPQGQKKQVQVVITSADTNSINAYVSGVFEDGGTCTATLTKGSQVLTRTSSGFGNVSTTNCTPISPNFPSGGPWTVKVSYSSATAEGTSQEIVVQ